MLSLLLLLVMIDADCVRSPNARTVETIDWPCSIDTHRLDFGTNMTPMNEAPDRHATSASSGFVIPQTLFIQETVQKSVYSSV